MSLNLKHQNVLDDLPLIVLLHIISFVELMICELIKKLAYTYSTRFKHYGNSTNSYRNHRIEYHPLL